MKVCPHCQRSFTDGQERCPEDGSWLQPATTSRADPLDRFLGRMLSGRYRLEQRLGAGSVGVVFRGVDLKLGRPVAVKLLLPRGFMEPRAARRLKREFRVLSQLDNPHIVKAYELGETEEQIPFLVMEYVQGQDLGQLLQQRHRLEPALALRLAAQILDALSCAHAHGVIHRDLKADNVHLTQVHGVPDFVKVLDFGLVKFYDVGERNHATSLTAAHLVVGTPHYMAPEQIRGGELGPWTDLYALGVMLHRMLTGELPFPGTDPLQVMRAHVQQLPLPLGALLPGVPPQLELLVHDLLEKDPRRRPASAARALERLHETSLWALWQQQAEQAAALAAQPGSAASGLREPAPPSSSVAAWPPGPAESAATPDPWLAPWARHVSPAAPQPATAQPATRPALPQPATRPALPQPATRPALPLPAPLPPGTPRTTPLPIIRQAALHAAPSCDEEPGYLWLVALSWGVALATAIAVAAILG